MKIFKKDLIKYKKNQCEIDEKESEILNLSKEITKIDYEDCKEERKLKGKLHYDILDIEWNAKTNEERLESRKHNIKYFRKWDFPDFKKENYTYEFIVIDYTESLLKVIPIIDGIRGVNKRPKLLAIKEWFHQELFGLLFSRKEIKLQEYNEFLEWMEIFVTKAPYRNLQQSEQENINRFLEKIKIINAFKNKKVKFWY